MTKPRVTLVYGPDGCGKSSFTVSSTRATEFAEMDAGSFARAFCEQPDLITVRKFYSPPTALEDIGRISTKMMGESGKGAIQVVHNYRGWREKFSAFVTWVLDVTEGDSPDIVVDTVSRGYRMSMNALRQRIQEDVPANLQAERLKRLEYEEPNSQWDAIVDRAKETDKNLYLVAHENQKWGGDGVGFISGTHEPDAWRSIRGDVDIVLRFYVEEKQAVAVIEKGPMELLGLKIIKPTIPKFDALLDSRDEIIRAGMSVPGEFDMVLKLAGSL